MRVNKAYLVISAGLQISINSMYQNFTPTMNYTVSSTITDIACSA